MNSQSRKTTICAECGCELGPLDFSIKSLFHMEGYVCQDCAIREDSEWLENPHTLNV